MNLPFPEARERLMNRIKNDNAEIKQQEKEMAEVKRTIETYQRNIKDIDADLKDRKKDGGEDLQKFEILYKKEKEIVDYMEKFEHETEGYNKQIKDAQGTIEALLMHMQKTLARQKRLPTQ
jgi:intraflagellar transport protein 74